MSKHPDARTVTMPLETYNTDIKVSYERCAIDVVQGLREARRLRNDGRYDETTRLIKDLSKKTGIDFDAYIDLLGGE